MNEVLVVFYLMCLIRHNLQLNSKTEPTASLPIIPVRLEMLLSKFHHTIEPLPKCEVPSWKAFLWTENMLEAKSPENHAGFSLTDSLFRISLNQFGSLK